MSKLPRSPDILLGDMLEECVFLQTFVAGHDQSRFDNDRPFRMAVERGLITIGEALFQLNREFPAIASQVPEHVKIITFRHILVHGYADIESSRVWLVVTTKLEPLRIALAQMLEDLK
ncbi:MAG: HepT-like ribonuclease domain-containing protein [Phycisphaeraceae bacterium]